MDNKLLKTFLRQIEKDKNWVNYHNGNYDVYIDTLSGTKIKYNELDSFDPSTIESCDIKITNSCDMGCPMCHENSIPNGKHGDILSPSWLDKLHPYCELAIGGGNPLEHPDLDEFLIKCKERKHLPNMTVNQTHFIANYDRIKKMKDDKLIYGLGISLTNPTDEFIEKVKTIPNVVIHTIAGITSIEQYEILAHKNLRVLILGYKYFRRGKTLYDVKSEDIDSKLNELKFKLPEMIKNKWFNVMSFDNLSLKQLNVRSFLSKKEWEEFYQGDDGLEGQQTSATMFIDMVERNFAKNSCATERYPLMNTAEEMYQFLKELR